MSRIPVPERGQPLDLSYIYTIAQAVNELSEKGSAFTQANNFFFKGAKSATLQSSKLYAANIYAAYTVVASDTSVQAGTEKVIPVSFSPDVTFDSPPVVTVTPVALSENNANSSVALVISNLDASGFNLTAKFGASGKVSVGVNIIAVGPPTR